LAAAPGVRPPGALERDRPTPPRSRSPGRGRRAREARLRRGFGAERAGRRKGRARFGGDAGRTKPAVRMIGLRRSPSGRPRRMCRAWGWRGHWGRGAPPL